jgi:hypothetical protein
MDLGAYVRRIIQDKDNLDKGLLLALKAVDLSQAPGKLPMLQSLAQVYLLKGDKAKAVETAPSEQMKNIFRKQIDQIKASQEKK